MKKIENDLNRHRQEYLFFLSVRPIFHDLWIMCVCVCVRACVRVCVRVCVCMTKNGTYRRRRKLYQRNM